MFSYARSRPCLRAKTFPSTPLRRCLKNEVWETPFSRRFRAVGVLDEAHWKLSLDRPRCEGGFGKRTVEIGEELRGIGRGTLRR